MRIAAIQATRLVSLMLLFAGLTFCRAAPRLDEALAARPGAAALRARSTILAMSEALTQHAAYFDAEAPG